MGALKWIEAAGLGVAAPFTGGTSLLALPGVLAQGNGGNSAAKAPDPKDTKALTETALTQGKDLFGSGQDLASLGVEHLGPLFQYFSKLASGDFATEAQAAAPDVARISDQYDTARRAISNFAPRGGGSNAAVANSYTREGSDIATSLATARRSGMSELGSLATGVAGLGINAQSAGMNEITNVLSALFGQESANKQMWAGIAGSAGEAAGTIIGAMIGKGK